MDKLLIPAVEVARRAGVDYRTIQKWSAMGIMPAPVFKSRWRADEVDAWLRGEWTNAPQLPKL